MTETSFKIRHPEAPRFHQRGEGSHEENELAGDHSLRLATLASQLKPEVYQKTALLTMTQTL